MTTQPTSREFLLFMLGVDAHHDAVNKAQKIALGIGFSVFVVSLFFVPCWDSTDIGDRTISGGLRLPFWEIYDESDGPFFAGILLDWTIIAVLTGGAFLFLGKTKSS